MLGCIVSLERSLGEGNGYPLQYSCLENSMDRSWGCKKSEHDWVTFISLHMVNLGKPRWPSSKESACSAGDMGSVPGLGRSPGRGNGYPLQYSCQENPMDKGDWWATVHRGAKTWLSTHTYTHMVSLIKIMFIFNADFLY